MQNYAWQLAMCSFSKSLIEDEKNIQIILKNLLKPTFTVRLIQSLSVRKCTLVYNLEKINLNIRFYLRLQFQPKTNTCTYLNMHVNIWFESNNV